MNKRQQHLIRAASRDNADSGTRWRDRCEAWITEGDSAFLRRAIVRSPTYYSDLLKSLKTKKWRHITFTKAWGDPSK